MSFEDRDVETGRSYWYRLGLIATDGRITLAGPLRVVAGGMPLRTALFPPFEPPGGGPVRIRYSVPTCARERARLAIYDVRGRLVRMLADGEQDPGEPSAVDQNSGEQVRIWDRRDESGSVVLRGVYFVRLDAGGAAACRKLLLLHASAR